MAHFKTSAGLDLKGRGRGDHYFALGIPTCWYLKMLKFAFPPTQHMKFAFPPTQNPNASQWNIGCIGSLALGLCVGHVHFIFFVLISFALGSRRKCSFQWNIGLSSGPPCLAPNRSLGPRPAANDMFAVI